MTKHPINANHGAGIFTYTPKGHLWGWQIYQHHASHLGHGRTVGLLMLPAKVLTVACFEYDRLPWIRMYYLHRIMHVYIYIYIHKNLHGYLYI